MNYVKMCKPDLNVRVKVWKKRKMCSSSEYGGSEREAHIGILKLVLEKSSGLESGTLLRQCKESEQIVLTG